MNETIAPNDRLLTKEELAQYLQVTTRTVTIWIKKRRLPHYRLGCRRVRFKRSEIDAHFAANRPAEYSEL